jgi:Ser/Thr protein kinase RdoA (MazF antagonist)
MDAALRELEDHGYELDGALLPRGRPDRATVLLRSAAGARVVAKLYPSGDGESAYTNLLELWRSSFGESRVPPGLPRPLDFVAGAGAVIMERLEGRPLGEFEEPEEATLDAAIGLLASLHESDAAPVRCRDGRRIVRSLARKAERIAELAPELAPCFRTLVARLAQMEPDEPALVPCHGDFSPRNVLVGARRLALIDFDRLQRADPARDIAYFGAWYWMRAVRRQQPPDWSALARAVARYDALRVEAAVRERVPFHVAAGLARMAHSLVELCPEQARLVPRLTGAALAQLP